MPKAESGAVDVTGRDRIARNVLASWGGYLVLIVAGFIMPRLIDRTIGQAALGVWDFCWSLVAYFGLIQAGVVSSINRYVARFRATGDIAGVNRSVSSVTCVLALMASAIVVLTVLTTWAAPLLLREQLGAFTSQARWVVFLLGLSLSVQVALAGYGGVLTGCHRWDIHNYVYAGSHSLALAGMLIALAGGAGLAGLALAHLAADTLGWTSRIFFAHRACPGLQVRWRLSDTATARGMIKFGGKSFVPQIGQLLQFQTTNVLIIAFLGAPALALYARPAALLRHLLTIVQKFAVILTPTTSSMQSMGREDEARELLLTTTRYAAYLTLPAALLLAIMGAPILILWMGPAYEQGSVIAILALGQLPYIVHTPILSTLAGLNLHGRPGVAYAVAAACSAALVAVAIGLLDWGTWGAALAVSAPLCAISTLYIPTYACHALHCSQVRFWKEVWAKPLACAAPFAVILAGSRVIFSANPEMALACGIGGGGLVLAVIYWRVVVPRSIKESLARRMRFGRAAAVRPSA